MELQWVDGTVDLQCPVCKSDASQRLLARVAVDWRNEPVDIARCTACDAVILGATESAEYPDAAWDLYVEQIAGIEAIADMLVQAGVPRGSRMLDVGCGYGFALDLARFLLDAKGIGLDPSTVAERGRRDLDLDIRPGTLDDAFEPQERFDVIFSSEVIEHVADPREFLEAIQRRLAPDGIVVLSTPDASVILPETPWPTLYAVLSVGRHVFVVDAAGLERMLADAGLQARVWRVGPSLLAVASRDARSLTRVQPNKHASLFELAGYCEARGTKAVAGSALAVGMASRHLKWMIAGGDFARAASNLPALRQALYERHGIDLDDPLAVLGRLELPSVLTGIFLYRGLLELWHERNPKRAAEWFEAAAWTGRAHWTRHAGYLDPETPICEGRARAELAVILVQVAPERVDGVLAELDDGIEREAGDAQLAKATRERVEYERAPHRSRTRRMYRRLRRLAGRVKRRLRQARQ